jgi:hypothetical protein
VNVAGDLAPRKCKCAEATQVRQVIFDDPQLGGTIILRMAGERL